MGSEAAINRKEQILKNACQTLESEIYHRIDLFRDKARSQLDREGFEAARFELAKK
ncbi:Uncharacterized protein dnm_070830 [Desulfonema magnum]|uniref:Uncharacterized protein n=1 Tax=Desulfonema magnum TaxID=45655 RepID=A0A975GRH8_9BACT|nr:Uncharacterized protein dnm_070830 [Desulfonema magnum]